MGFRHWIASLLQIDAEDEFAVDRPGAGPAVVGLHDFLHVAQAQPRAGNALGVVQPGEPVENLIQPSPRFCC